MVKPFVILMLSTSGSSWLQELLDSHEQIRCEAEVFNNAPVQKALDFLDSTTGKSGESIRGFKISRDALSDGSDTRFYELLDGLRARRARLICLGRRNYVKRAVSQMRHRLQVVACGSARTHVEDAECLRNISSALPIERDPRGMSLAQNIQIAREQYTQMLRECEAEQLLHYGPDHNVRVLLLFYEDLMADTENILAGLQAWLGASKLQHLASSMVKVTETNLSKAISNFAEVEQYVQRVFGDRSFEHQLLLEGT